MQQTNRPAKRARPVLNEHLAAPASRARVGIDFFFVARPERGHSVGFHEHEALEIVYYTEGEGRTTVGGERCRIVRNTFAIVPAGTQHDQNSKTDLVAICLGLTNSGLDDLAGGHYDSDGLLRRPLERLASELQREEPAFETVCQGLVLEIIGLARRAAMKGRMSGKKVVVDRALEMIRERDGVLSIDDLSEHLYVSKDYLRHLFKEYTRESPLRHIINRRIEKAKTLLGRDDLAIGEVASQSGIANPYYFSRLFKQITGRTPSAYRRTLSGA